MGFRLHPALVVVLAVVICGGLILGIGWLRTRRLSTTEALMAHLPPEEAVILAVNLASLRQSGILSALTASKITEEPEYRAFVQETGFDYQQDIDLILAWFRRETTYILLRGSFDWARLRAYVTAQGGACHNTFCNLEGSTPQRKISFFPLNKDVMALAVSPADGAAWALISARPGRPGRSVPDRPAWLLVPISVLRDAGNLPAGTRLFAQAMAGADKVQLSLNAPGGRPEVLLDADCRTAEDASTLSSQLESATRLLKETIAREKQTPNPGDLSGVLAAGSFRSEGQRVLGRWPVERAFLESILGGTQ